MEQKHKSLPAMLLLLGRGILGDSLQSRLIIAMTYPLLNEYIGSSVVYQRSYNINSLVTAQARAGGIVTPV